MSEPKITTEARGPLLLIGLNRPAKLNAFDAEMLTSLREAFAKLDAEPALRCGVLFAHGDHFTAGLDLVSVGPLMAQGKLDLSSGIDPWGVHGEQRRKPTVVAVKGRCLTAGIELVLAQDICVAAESTRFAQIEIRRGIFPFGGATFRWPQRCGWGNAMRWLLTGDELDAAEALRIGLVQEVVPAGAELERAIAIATTVAAQAPLAVQETIASARRSLVEEASARALLPELMRLMQSDDAREGMMSFLQRRTATFTGK